MAKNTPYVSTFPLDLLAMLMSCIVLLNTAIIFIIAFSVLITTCGIDFRLNKDGFNILITQQRTITEGYGLTFSRGLRVWKYQRNAQGQPSAEQIFP